MKPEEFIKIVRKGSDKLRVDEIILDTGNARYHDKGTLHVSPASLDLAMVLDDGPAPEMKSTGVYTKSDNWKISGVIEDLLPFKCDHVIGGDYSYHSDWDKKQLVTIKFNLNLLELISRGTDKYSSAELEEIKAQMMREQNLAPPESPKDEKSDFNGPTVEFFSLLKDYPIPTLLCQGTEVVRKNPYFGERRSGRLDTIKGEVVGFEYAFIKQDENDDLAVHFKSLPGYSSPDSDTDWKMFYSLMMSLAMIQGINAWPYRIAYWRDGRKITEKITPSRRLSKTFHTPFQSNEFIFQNVIRLGFEFFKVDEKINNEVSNLLFLFREASDYESVHGDITVIAICVLFESLVNLIFTGLKLADKFMAQSGEIASFLAAQKDVTEFINSQVELGRKGFSRLSGIVEGAQSFTIRERLNAVTDHFGLKWEGQIELVFQTWREIRNPIVHGKARTGQTEAESKNAIYSLARIAGGFNILALKVIGYSGNVMTSAFDTKTAQI